MTCLWYEHDHAATVHCGSNHCLNCFDAYATFICYISLSLMYGTGLGKCLRTNVRGVCVGPSAMKVRSWSLGIVLEPPIKKVWEINTFRMTEHPRVPPQTHTRTTARASIAHHQQPETPRALCRPARTTTATATVWRTRAPETRCVCVCMGGGDACTCATHARTHKHAHTHTYTHRTPHHALKPGTSEWSHTHTHTPTHPNQ